MNLDFIKSKIEQNKKSLIKKYHLKEIGLFGSILREDFDNQSDIDIIVDLYKPIGLQYFELKEELENLLKRRVDLIIKKGIKPALRKKILKEVIYI